MLNQRLSLERWNAAGIYSRRNFDLRNVLKNVRYTIQYNSNFPCILKGTFSKPIGQYIFRGYWKQVHCLKLYILRLNQYLFVRIQQ